MALALKNSPSSALYNLNKLRENSFLSSSSSLLKRSSSSKGFGLWKCNYRNSNGLRACSFNPIEEPILKEALKEPIAFAGGVFAGLLRLDLNEDPLKEWVTRTVEAAGITVEEIDAEGSKTEEENAPEQIEIE